MLVYVDDEVAGWCSVAPRSSYRRLLNSRTIPILDDADAWPAVCFVVRAGFRKHGLMHRLLAGAVEHARAHGAEVVEGYPVETGGGRVDVISGYVGIGRAVRGGRFRAGGGDHRPERRAAALGDAPGPALTWRSVSGSGHDGLMTDTNLRLGITYVPYLHPEHLRDLAQAAQECGLDDLWVWEDCFKQSGVAAAAAALAWTDTVRVGIGLLPVPLRNVALTAMEIATLSRLFPGRLLPGIGHGVQPWMAQVGGRVASPLDAAAGVRHGVAESAGRGGGQCRRPLRPPGRGARWTGRRADPPPWPWGATVRSRSRWPASSPTCTCSAPPAPTPRSRRRTRS